MVKKPQPLAQTCQSTPALVASLATDAFRLTVALGCICDGNEGMKLTESAVSGLMVIGAEVMLRVASAFEVAVSVAVVPGDVTGGAVYSVVDPLAVCAGTNQPHAPGVVLAH
jgi:hypothetical protein